MRIEFSEQVVNFVRTRAPEPRKRLRQALRALGDDKGDIKSLEGELRNYHRLRAGPFRIVFAYRIVQGQRAVECIFCEHRSVVYELFSAALRHLR